MVRSRHGGGDLGFVRRSPGERAERGELLDDDVAVALVALVAPPCEKERFAADERARVLSVGVALPAGFLI